MKNMLEKVLAPLLVGTWINSFLFMWEILQVISYFKYYKDPLALRLVVSVAFVVDCWSTFNSFIMVYLYHVTHWGDLSYILIQHWPLPVNVLTVSITTSIVQSFLVYRYYSISKKWYTTAGLLLILATSIVGGIGTTVGLFHFVAFGITPLADAFVKLWLSATSASGILVASCLVYELSKIRTAFKSTRTLIRRLVFNAIQAGLAPAIVCTITLGVYLNDRLNNIGMGIALCAGRIYALTMLWNLNMRKRTSKNDSSSGRIPGAPGDLTDSLQLTGIHIHRTAIVHIDETKVGETKSFDESSNSPRPRDDEPIDGSEEKKDLDYQVPQLESRIRFPS